MRWLDTSTSTVGIDLRIQNVRWEQEESGTGYFVDIEHNYNLHQLSIEHVYGGLNAGGFKLRKVRHATLRTTDYDGTGEALNVDSTVYPLLLENSWFQAGSTITASGLTKVLDSGQNALGGPLSALVLYDVPSSSNVTPNWSSLSIREGVKISKHLSATVAWNPGSVTDGSATFTTVTVAGAVPSDICLASHSALGANNVLLMCHIQADGVARVVLLNKTGAATPPLAGTLRVDVW